MFVDVVNPLPQESRKTSIRQSLSISDSAIQDFQFCESSLKKYLAFEGFFVGMSYMKYKLLEVVLLVLVLMKVNEKIVITYIVQIFVLQS